MPFETPTLPVLISRTTADLASDALRQSDAQVLARAVSGAAYGLYGYLDWIAKQILPDTADAATLERQALLRLETPRIAAKSATGTASFQASAGSILDANLVVQASDGRQYRVVTAVNPVPGANTAELEAVEGGALGNAVAGVALKLVQPVAGIDETFTVLAPGITGGSDQESIESLRSRVIRSYRVIPHGGNAEDYVTWALECAGVTRAWAVRNYMGPGTVGVFFVRDGDASIIPDANEVATVKAYISTKAPVTAEVYVLAPVLKAINYTLKIPPDTTVVRSAVAAELADLHEREAGLGETLLISHIREAISSAEGEMDNLVSSPVSDVTAKANELLTVGTFTWL
ncbi:baseplate J/gp47 family protein [Pseudomonas sp. CFBP 8758]|uniref:baseplate J/gp47 family protein n=1 Tax=Pseudomonas sp. CFBP 8758 TaxID=2775286 RepID=UPI00178774F9|nr:baseplate J/gp47 family protein [Pseudomonas sp. CFBP 8758]MBD8592370.1 baseplate J/gp47 family protein [Pseudomonas sp. CFBP 8758]